MNVCFILSEYCSTDSYVIFFCFAFRVRLRFIKCNTFSIVFKSGLRYGIEKSFAPILLSAFLATALFWLGSPSWMNVRLFGRLHRRKMSLKLCSWNGHHSHVRIDDRILRPRPRKSRRKIGQSIQLFSAIAFDQLGHNWSEIRFSWFSRF